MYVTVIGWSPIGVINSCLLELVTESRTTQKRSLIFNVGESEKLSEPYELQDRTLKKTVSSFTSGLLQGVRLYKRIFIYIQVSF